MKHVLITGANGFVGQHTIDHLIGRGFEIHAISHSSTPPNISNVTWHKINLLDNKQTDNFIAELKANYLLHLAWYTHPDHYWHSLDNFQWLQASINLTISFATHGGQRAVFAGSCAEYDWSHSRLIEYKTPSSMNSPYSACKNLLHSFIQNYTKFTELSYAWGRLFFLFGPHENPGRLVPCIIKSLLTDQVAKCNNGNLLRDYLYVEDAANALVSLLDSTASGPFNIASGKSVSIKEIADKIKGKIGGKGRIEYNTNATGHDEYKMIVADINRLTGETGWQPYLTLDSALDKTIAWWIKDKTN